jgi:hypothetical protein
VSVFSHVARATSRGTEEVSPQEKLALADYLVIDAGESPEPTSAQLVELDRRYADAIAHPELLIEPDEALRRLKR